MRILLGGIPLGCNNIGDEAIIACVVRLLRERLPDVSLTVCTADSATAEQLGVAVAPPFGFVDVSTEGFATEVVRHEAYVWCGATGLSDYPRKGCDLLETAQRVGVPTYVWGVGMDDELNPAFYRVAGIRRRMLALLGLVGVYERWLHRCVASRLCEALKGCRLVAVRDPESVEELRKCGFMSAVVCADTALLLPSAPRSELPRVPGVRTVALCVSAQRAVRDLSGVIRFCNRLLEEPNLRMICVPMNPKTDRALMTGLLPHLRDASRVTMASSVVPEEVQALVADCDLVVSSRLHLLFFAMNVSTPVIGVARGSKIANGLRPLGLKPFGTVNACDWDALARKALRLLKPEIRVAFAARVSAVREALRVRMDLTADVFVAELLGRAVPSLAGHAFCTGCGACVDACPRDGIRMVEDAGGFRFPKADPFRCGRCRACVRACPVLTVKPRPTPPKACFAARVRDRTLLGESTSGGVFSAVAGDVFARGGVVFGAVLGEDFVCRHVETGTPEGLSAMRGSKYVQSDLVGVFRAVRTALKNGRPALFSGTLCQIAGLRRFLGGEAEGLITFGILCHGVPSQTVFDRARAAWEQRGGVLKSMAFRSKRHGWGHLTQERTFVDGTTECEPYDRGFGQAYLRGLCMRECCYDCRFQEGRSGADIVTADFWGVGRLGLPMDDDLGVSAVMLYTTVAKALWARIASTLEAVPVALADIVAGNSSYDTPTVRPSSREAYLRALFRGASPEGALRRARYGHPLMWPLRWVCRRLKSTVP